MSPGARQMVAASALAASAGIHLAVVRTHMSEALTHGAFFLALGLLQAVWAVRILRRASSGERRLIGGVHLAVIALWLISRTTGLPGEAAEAVGIADVIATLSAATVAAVTLRGAPARARRAMAVAPTAVLALALSVSVGVAVGATPTEHGHSTHADGAHGSDGAHGEIEGVHLHGLSSAPDPGAQPGRRADARLDVTLTSVGSMPTAIAAGVDRVWVTDRQDGTLTELDPEGRVLRTANIAAGPTAVTVAFGSVWVTDFTSDTLVRVDPETLRATTIAVGGGPTSVIAVGDELWVTSISDGLVQAVDPERSRVVATIPVGFGPTSLSSDGESVWVVNSLDRNVVRVNASARRIVGAPTPVSAGASGSIYAFGRLWVAAATDGIVDSIDPVSGVRHPISVDDLSGPGQGPISVTESGGRIWVANNHDKTVRSIDPETFEVGAPLFFSNTLGSHPIAVQLVPQGGSLWITDFQSGTVARIRG